MPARSAARCGTCCATHLAATPPPWACARRADGIHRHADGIRQRNAAQCRARRPGGLMASDRATLLDTTRGADFAGSVVLVAGGTGGLGAAVSREFAAARATVVVTCCLLY